MERRIYKYPLVIVGQQGVKMPSGAHILSVDCQNDVLCIWATIDPLETTMVIRHILIIGTGNPFYENLQEMTFIGTAQMSGGALIWHVFEIDP